MADRTKLLGWVIAALEELGGKAELVRVAEHIWKNHESELRDSRRLFYTWQYDMRSAATKLRKQRKLADASETPRGVWALKR